MGRREWGSRDVASRAATASESGGGTSELNSPATHLLTKNKITSFSSAKVHFTSGSRFPGPAFCAAYVSKLSETGGRRRREGAPGPISQCVIIYLIYLSLQN